jgi:hypothetical protein
MKKSIECLFGVPQPVIEIPLAKRADAPTLEELDFATIFERLIIGPSPYQWPMFEAFAETLGSAGVTDPGSRVSTSDIPIRT